MIGRQHSTRPQSRGVKPLPQCGEALRRIAQHEGLAALEGIARVTGFRVRALCIFVAGFLAVGPIASAGAAERDVRHEFAVQPGCLLRIDTYRGEVTVTESDDPTVQVTIHMEVGGDTA